MGEKAGKGRGANLSGTHKTGRVSGAVSPSSVGGGGKYYEKEGGIREIDERQRILVEGRYCL